MDCIFKRLIENKTDEEIHREFVKYSKGVFEHKYLIEGKKQKSSWTIKTSAEFANFLVRLCLEKAKSDIVVKGVIVSTFDIRSGMGGYVFNPEEEVKQFMGIKQLKVDGTVQGKKIIEIMDKFPKAFFALSFTLDGTDLKIKPKAPKSAKPAASGDKVPAPEFCTVKTADVGIVKSILFDVPDFSVVGVSHTIKINDIILPKGQSDPVKIREMAVRKGAITRIINIDGKEKRTEIPFEA